MCDPIDGKLQGQDAHHVGAIEDGREHEAHRAAEVGTVEFGVDDLESITITGAGQRVRRLGQVRGRIGAIPQAGGEVGPLTECVDDFQRFVVDEQDVLVSEHLAHPVEPLL